ncbi:MAG: DUF4071 domain-containing protein [Alphaproteobacteria bacterium]|nr:DUF4071 domain-containing protein [Alphaproteobacteria bacterium]
MNDLVDALIRGAATVDDDALEDCVADSLRAPPPSPVQAVAMLSALRDHRRFAALRRLGDGLLRLGFGDRPEVARLYAQGLIDGGLLYAAEILLTGIEGRIGREAPERGEVLGLLGRLHKQGFVLATTPEARQRSLRAAVTWYGRAFDEDPRNAWVGINLAALLARAERDGVRLADRITGREVAGRVLATLSLANAWDWATAAEACLALGDETAVLDRLRDYVAHPGCTAFALAGTLRQFEEIWGLGDDATGFGASVMMALKGALLRKDQGAARFTTAQAGATDAINGAVLQRILGEDGPATWTWLCQGLLRGCSVAAVRRANGATVATAFLLRGGDLAPGLGDGLVCLTNAHVIHPEGLNDALRPQDARIAFTTPQGRQSVHRVECLWHAEADQHDATLLRLDPPPDRQPCPIAAQAPRADGQGRVYAIGHPRGGALAISLNDARLIGVTGGEGSSPRRYHYRTPTEKGHSGGPVFDEGWEAVALHRAGAREDDPKGLNQGICLRSIGARIAREGVRHG